MVFSFMDAVKNVIYLIRPYHREKLRRNNDIDHQIRKDEEIVVLKGGRKSRFG